MKQEEWKKIWQETPLPENLAYDQAELLINLKKTHQQFEQKINARDKVEIGVALVMIPVFVSLLYFLSSPLAKIGAGIIVAFLIGLILLLRHTKSRRKEYNLADSFYEQLKNMRANVLLQHSLLSNVLYWYLIPPFIGVALFMWGVAPGSPATVMLMVFIVVGYGAIYLINQQAVKNEINPLLQSLSDTMAELEKKE